MIITTHIQESAFNILVNYKFYQTNSKYCLLFFHGSGEIGVADGSQINKVEVHGYPKHAKNGFQFPFNIIAVQAQNSYSNIRKNFPGYIKLKYGFDVVGATGLSMGGFCTADIPRYDSAKVVDFIAPVCGGFTYALKPVGEDNPVLNAIADPYPIIPAWWFHGDKDTVVPMRKSKEFVDRYNLKHDPDMKYTIYPGVAHNAWDKAYSVKPGEDELLQWIIQQFDIFSSKENDWKNDLVTYIQKY